MLARLVDHRAGRVRKGQGHTPEMNGHEKSDSPVFSELHNHQKRAVSRLGRSLEKLLSIANQRQIAGQRYTTKNRRR